MTISKIHTAHKHHSQPKVGVFLVAGGTQLSRLRVSRLPPPWSFGYFGVPNGLVFFGEQDLLPSLCWDVKNPYKNSCKYGNKLLNWLAEFLNHQPKLTASLLLQNRPKLPQTETILVVSHFHHFLGGELLVLGSV